jgi:hypothetical protein
VAKHGTRWRKVPPIDFRLNQLYHLPFPAAIKLSAVG